MSYSFGGELEVKKPEFPKPRIIREDFLPEQDPMSNYRIKKVTKPDGKEWYYPQKKFLWFWMTLDDGGGYGCENWAHARVFGDYNKTLKDKVEYLSPDISKTVTTKPNPYKKYTPEETEQSLKEAFREAVKQGVVSSSTKQKSLYDVIYDWWEDVFTTHSDWDMETSIDNLVDEISLWLPKEQSAAGSQNAYVECTVEGFNDCLNKIKRKLR